MNKLESVERFVEEVFYSQRHANSQNVLKEIEDCRLPNKQPIVPSATAIHHCDRFSFGEMEYFFVHPNEEPSKNRIIIYLHGGAYIYQPLDAHWSLARHFARRLNCDVVMPIYLKAPNHTCEESVSTLVNFYIEVIVPMLSESTEVIFMGDSAGGSLSLVLAQQLDSLGIATPEHVIMFSPSVDLSFMNELAARELEPSDIMLQINRLKIIRNVWRANLNDTDPRVSQSTGI